LSDNVATRKALYNFHFRRDVREATMADAMILFLL